MKAEPPRAQLCQIRWIGTRKLRGRAAELLVPIAGNEDALLATQGACPENPFKAGWIDVPER